MLLCGACNPGATGHRAIVRYNISVNDGSRLLLAVGTNDSHFYNNTFYLPAGSTTRIIEEGTPETTVAFTNNIFVNLGTVDTPTERPTIPLSATFFMGTIPPVNRRTPIRSSGIRC